jgi:hypothetical protein
MYVCMYVCMYVVCMGYAETYAEAYAVAYVRCKGVSEATTESMCVEYLLQKKDDSNCYAKYPIVLWHIQQLNLLTLSYLQSRVL